MRFPFGKKPVAPRREKPSECVVITGAATVTPVGCSTWRTALGVRFRKTAWCEHEEVLLPDDRHGVVLRGATISRVPEDFIHPTLDGAERAIALLSPALAACLGVLSPNQIHCLECRIDNFILKDNDHFFHLLRSTFPVVNFEPNDRYDPGLGRCSFFERIMRAAEELRSGYQQRIIVGCVDSLCATSWLRMMRDYGVIKDAMTPDGIIPGEAAGVVILERESAAISRGATILARLSSWGRGEERNSWYVGIPATGGGLTEALLQAISETKDGATSIATVIADLNGEPARALDWAYAEGRAFSGAGVTPELRHPAFIVGDCGAATGAVLLADALGAFVFHPFHAGGIALTTSDESGARRVLCLERGDAVDRRQLICEIRNQSPTKFR